MKIIALFLTALIAATPFGANCTSREETQISVKNFGAKGDGITDDYNALLAAANYINSKGSGTLLFPKGTYFIKSYSSQQKKYKNIQFANCNNLIIKGEEATISVNGNFRRTKDFEAGIHGNGNSYVNAVIPFLFTNCKNVTLSGFKINGNVNRMTRDANLAEGQAHLVMIDGCEHVTLKDLTLMYAQTDGIYITGTDKPSFDVKMYNVISTNNARQGLSITGLSGGEFNNCKFLNTGQTNGNYGFHLPAAGVDIEPRIFKQYRTGNIVFNSCTFSNNKGNQFICTSPLKTSNIILKRCTIVSTGDGSKYTMVLSAVNVVVDSCNVDCGNGDIVAVGKVHGSSVNIINSTIKSNSSGIVAQSSDESDSINIKNNTLICTAPDKMQGFFPYLRAHNLTFLNNHVFIPSKVINTKAQNSMVESGLVSKGNTFSSEKKSIKPRVSYSGTTNVSDK